MRFLHGGGPRGPLTFGFELICVFVGMSLICLEGLRSAQQGRRATAVASIVGAVLVGLMVAATGLGALLRSGARPPKAPGATARGAPSTPTVRRPSEPRPYEAALDDLSHTDPQRRLKALSWISAAEPQELQEEISEALEALMRDEDMAIRLQAVAAWRRWHTPERSAGAVDTLIELMGDDHISVRDAAMEALAGIDDERVGPALAERLTQTTTRRSAGDLLRQMGPRAQRAVAPYLRHEDRAVRREALDVLEQVATEESVPALTEVLGGDDSLTRSRALDILARLQSEQAAAPVATLLCSVTTRSQAARCLKAIGPAAESAVVVYLEHEDPSVVQIAWGILAEIATEKSVPQMIEAMPREIAGAKSKAIKALARTEDERVIEPIAAELAKPWRVFASPALKEFGPAAEEAVLNWLSHQDPEVVVECCAILQTIGTKKSLAPLSNLAGNSDSRVSSAAERASEAILAREGEEEGPAAE
jgi:HEAT repeat protein